VIRERNAEIVSGGNVFYNPVQEFNRDLSIAVLNVYFRRLAKERIEKAIKKQRRKVKKEDEGKPSPVPEDESVYVAGTRYEFDLFLNPSLKIVPLLFYHYILHFILNRIFFKKNFIKNLNWE